jgi:NUMOD4 motif./HNH endonuclease.
MKQKIKLEELDPKHWKPTYIYPERYLVSDKGEVYSVINNAFLKHQLHRGYHRVRLASKGKSRHASVHQLVARAFIPNPENKLTVDHINGDKVDNRVENLRWTTLLENVRNPNTLPKVQERGRKQIEYLKSIGKKGTGVKPGTRTKRNVVEVYKDGVLVKTFKSQRLAAEFVGVNETAVYRYLLGDSINRDGFTFKRVEDKL